MSGDYEWAWRALEDAYNRRYRPRGVVYSVSPRLHRDYKRVITSIQKAGAPPGEGVTTDSFRDIPIVVCNDEECSVEIMTTSDLAQRRKYLAQEVIQAQARIDNIDRHLNGETHET